MSIKSEHLVYGGLGVFSIAVFALTATLIGLKKELIPIEYGGALLISEFVLGLIGGGAMIAGEHRAGRDFDA